MLQKDVYIIRPFIVQLLSHTYASASLAYLAITCRAIGAEESTNDEGDRGNQLLSDHVCSSQ